MARDVSGFEAAFDELYDVALRLAVRLVGSGAPAEDIAAEALVRTFVSWGRIGHAPWRTAWVLRVTTNLAADSFRGSRREHRDLPATATDIEETVVLRDALVSALAALPKRQREAVALRYLASMPEQEVAAALGISTGTVKTHLHRGLQALRSTIAPEEMIDVPHT